MEVKLEAKGNGNYKVGKARINLNLAAPLNTGVIINLGRKKVWVEFKYERLPHYCYSCGRIGHYATMPLLVLKYHIKNQALRRTYLEGLGIGCEQRRGNLVHMGRFSMANRSLLKRKRRWCQRLLHPLKLRCPGNQPCLFVRNSLRRM